MQDLLQRGIIERTHASVEANLDLIVGLHRSSKLEPAREEKGERT